MKSIKGLCWRWGNVQVKLRRFQIRQHAGEQPNTLIFCLYIDREFLVMPVSKETDFNFRVFKNILEGFHLKKKKKKGIVFIGILAQATFNTLHQETNS